MHTLPENLALTLPDVNEMQDIANCFGMVRAKEMSVRIVIGVGETKGRISLRALGYAKMVSEIIKRDIQRIFNFPQIDVHIFSSATKLAFLSGISDLTGTGQRALPALVTLAESLRISGSTQPISIDVAAPHREVPANISEHTDIPGRMQDQLNHFKDNNQSEANSRDYAIEHSPMFEDTGGLGPQSLRIFIGGKAEGFFWTIRHRVRTTTASFGHSLNPMLGLVMHGLKQPWYHVVPGEPIFADLLCQSKEQIEAIMIDLSKRRYPLKREISYALKFMQHLEVQNLAEATATLAGTLKLADDHGFQLGPRIKQLILKHYEKQISK